MVFKHHSLDAFYRKPAGAVPAGGQVRLRLCVKDAQESPDIQLRMWNGGEHRYPMRLLGMHDGEAIYEAQVGVCEEPGLLWYRFEAELHGEHIVLGAPADHTGCGEGVMGSEESFQITVYDPEYDTPEWMREGVMYQIMVDRFFHGQGTDALTHAKDGQNIILHENWDEMPFLNIAENGDNFANDFFGGNLEGVRQKLPYLKELGVSVLYFNPIFSAYTNHKYDTGDYRKIDPMFGSEQALRRLCEDAKKLGIHVMLDGVFSHVGDNSIYFNRRGTYGEHEGAYRDPNSPFFKWFTFRHWPDSYECWWGFKTLPNVNEMDEDYRRFILEDDDSVVRHWVRCGTSGWRLDVANEINDGFLRAFRAAVKAAKPDALLIGEVWEDGTTKVAYSKRRRYLLGSGLHGLMNYPFRTALLPYLAGTSGAEDFRDAMETIRENYPSPAFYGAMNFLSTHDTPRLLTLLGCEQPPADRDARAHYRLSPAERERGTALLKLAALVLYAFPGSPTVYYGDETGMEGFEDPFNRRTYPWGHEDTALLDWFRTLGRLRAERESLQSGGITYPLAAGRVLCFARRAGDEVSLCAVNAGAESTPVDLPWAAPLAHDALSGQSFLAEGGRLHITLAPYNALLLTE